MQPIISFLESQEETPSTFTVMYTVISLDSSLMIAVKMKLKRQNQWIYSLTTFISCLKALIMKTISDVMSPLLPLLQLKPISCAYKRCMKFRSSITLPNSSWHLNHHGLVLTSTMNMFKQRLLTRFHALMLMDLRSQLCKHASSKTVWRPESYLLAS